MPEMIVKYIVGLAIILIVPLLILLANWWLSPSHKRSKDEVDQQ
jgi:hypothetical protein